MENVACHYNSTGRHLGPPSQALCASRWRRTGIVEEILPRRDHLLTEGDVPWLTIAAARAQIAELKQGSQRQQLKSTWDADLPRPEEYATACTKDC